MANHSAGLDKTPLAALPRFVHERPSMISTGKLGGKFAEARFAGLVPGRYFTNHLKAFIP